MPAPITSLIVGGLGGAAAVGVVGTALIQIGVGLALTAVGVALARQNRPKNAAAPGIRTEVATEGNKTPQSIIFGKYATAGNLVAPFMSHEGSKVGEGKYRTHVYDLADVEIEDLTDVIINGEVFNVATDFAGTVDANYGNGVTSGGSRDRYAGKLWLKFYDGSQTTADAGLVAKYGSHPERPWASDMVGEGVSYAILTFKLDQKVWQGEPAAVFVCEGAKLYDPRTTTTVYTRNPVVMIWNILRGITLPDGQVWGLGVAEARLDATMWEGAMDACDTLVSGNPQYIAGFEARIANPDVGGDDPLAVIDQLLNACDGELVDMGGYWLIRVGEVALSAASITDDDILGSADQSSTPFRSLSQTFNGVHATYPSPNDAWNTKDAPPQYDATAETEDGERLIADIALTAVPDGDQVQRLMGAWLADARRMRQHVIWLPPEFGHLTPLDALSWTSTRHSYTSKIFEITDVVEDPMTLNVQLTIRERDPDDYDPITPSAESSPSTDLVAPTALTVDGFAVSASSVEDAAGADRRAAINITWSIAELPIVNAIQIEIRVDATTTVVMADSLADVEGGAWLISQGILPSTAYEVRAKWVADQESSWTAWTDVTTSAFELTDEDLAADTIRAVFSPYDVEVITTSQVDWNPKYALPMEMWLIGGGGGGGVGGHDTGNKAVGAGGGAGGLVRAFIKEPVLTDDYDITIGTPGTGGSVTLTNANRNRAANGTAATASSVTGPNSFSMTANGGGAGQGKRSTSSITAVGGAGGTASGGDNAWDGGDGGDAARSSDGSAAGGGGGISAGLLTDAADATDQSANGASAGGSPLSDALRPMRVSPLPFMSYDNNDFKGGDALRETGNWESLEDNEPYAAADGAPGCGGGGCAIGHQSTAGNDMAAAGGDGGIALLIVIYYRTGGLN